jgi:hypothetical protein
MCKARPSPGTVAVGKDGTAGRRNLHIPGKLAAVAAADCSTGSSSDATGSNTLPVAPV